MKGIARLGMTLVAVFATSVVACASAFAFTKIKNPKAVAENLKAVQVLGAAGEQRFTVGGKTVVCKKLTLTGTLAASASVESEEVDPKYEGCEVLGSTATVTHPACEDAFTFQEGVANGVKFEFKVKLNCEFKIKTALCELDVPGGQTHGKATTEDVAGNKPKVTANVSGITQTNNCGFGTGTGTYTGEVEVTEGEVLFE
jgi:hypothetical protein